MADAEAKPSRAGRIATFVALAITFVILIALGTWQVERLQWKEGLIAEIERRQTFPPISITTYDSMIKGPLEAEYSRMTVTGRFEHDKEQYFLATRDGDVGYYVYTPLVLEDRRVLFVNRGFVPEALKDPSKRLKGQVVGDVTLTGLVRAPLSTKPSWFVPDNEPSKRLYFWKDIGAMATQAGIATSKLEPMFLDAGPTPNPGGFPIGGVTQIDLPNNHLGYAVTWYGLAAALVVIAALAMRRKPR